MDENVGDAMTKPLLDKPGGGRGERGNGKDTDTVRNVLSGSQDLVQTPSLNKSVWQDTGHPFATATSRGSEFLSKTSLSTLISFLW